MRASHKRIWNGEVGGMCKGPVQDGMCQKHGRERLSGRTSENTGGEWCPCTLLQAFQSYIYFTNMY